MNKMVAEMRDVRRSFTQGDVTIEVLRGVDLAIREGELVALLGPSGTGKSTLLQALGLLEGGFTGSITIDGEEMRDAGPDRATVVRRQKLGFVYQFHHLLPDFDAFENVLLPQLIAGVDPEEAGSRARDLLSTLGLGARLEHRPSKLSGGEQQRVAIARAYVSRPAILIADEPTGNLDPATSIGIMKLLDRINREGTTVVMATHDSGIVDQMRKRVIELESGHVIRDQVRGVYGYTG